MPFRAPQQETPMNTYALLSAFAGFALVMGTLTVYFAAIPRGTVPVKVNGLTLRLVFGVALAAAGIYLGLTGAGSAGGLVYIPAVLALLFGGFILWVLPQRHTPLGDIKVVVGDPIIPFKALTTDGTPFNSSELAGKRVLLKFFRGGWCPYCVAELAEFNKMVPELEKMGVQIIALSKDTPDQAALNKSRDGLKFDLLSDPNLSVIRAYGVEHHKALGQTKNPKSTYGGLALGLAPFKIETMAIPTTLLIDETGVIRWIDQTDDYRLRSSTERVMSAVSQVFE
ncbi:redoxin domain-containing protein [Parasedimentitalea maritima]|uniref:thioredoxin-dependent peroxiredoxin n=2 Tax=Parasedimentitalea maritima TaxID=2578117 RepID=A0ABY2UWD6_9RHOB|nr:redoxin domain-containing protein [Zongyanglinia marina]